MQLIDASNRSHIWAEKYDRKLTDIFTVQDEITQTIVSALEPELDDAERRRAVTVNADQLDAWGAYHRGMWHIYKFTKDDTERALGLFEQAIQFEASFAGGWTGKSFAHFSNAFLGFAEDRTSQRQLALQAAQRGVELDERDAMAHWSLARAYLLDLKYDQAIAEFETAISLNPNFAQAYYQLGWALMWVSRPEEALPLLDLAERLSPTDPLRFAFNIVRAQALFMLRRFDEALESAETAARQPNAHAQIEAVRIACLVRTGNLQAAQSAMPPFLRKYPHYNRRFFTETHNFERPQDGELFIAALAEAGLPK